MITVPPLEEIKVFIKKIQDLSPKLGGVLKINTVDDAANLAVYLYGFSSWKEYLQTQKIKNENTIKEEYHFKKPKFKPIIMKSTELDLTREIGKTIKPSLVLKETETLPPEYLIGTTKDKITKGNCSIGLSTQGYIITVTDENEYESFLTKQINWLIHNYQSFSVFGLKPSDIKNPLKQKITEKNILLFNMENHKFDPIGESLMFNNLGNLLDIDLKDSQSFSWLWLLLVNTLKKEFLIKWSYKSLLNSLNISFLIPIK